MKSRMERNGDDDEQSYMVEREKNHRNRACDKN